MSHLVFGSFDKYIRHRTWDIPTSDIFGPSNRLMHASTLRPSPAAPIRCTHGASASPRERGRYRRCSAFARMATIRDSLNNFQGRFGMKRIITKISFACVFLMLGSTGLWAQATAQISGAVRDQSGAVLPGVEVTATQTETGIARTAVTN